MNYIHVEKSEDDKLLGAATDGRRLHIVEQLEIPDLIQGFWQVFKCGKQIIFAKLDYDKTREWKFPNWRKVLPDGEVKYHTIFTGYNPRERGNDYPKLTEFIRKFPEATVLNFKYLRGLGTSQNWLVEWYEKNKALKFTASNCTAIIMPMSSYE